MGSLSEALRRSGGFGLASAAGLQFGDYVIERALGQGAMGAVFLATDAQRERRVALKVLLPKGDLDATSRKRMLREATLPVAIDHQGIVPILDSGEIDGLPYLALEFIDGGTLEDEMKRGIMAPGRAVSVVLDITDALAAAQAAGIVHRDLKPANVMVRGSDGRALVTDFGVARNVDLASSLTKTGAMVGTPAYASPEQAVGETPDPSWDVFAAGVILYEALTGALPFQASTSTERLRRILTRDVVAPRTLNPDVSDALERVCLKALAPESAQRYANAAALADDLRATQRPQSRSSVVPGLVVLAVVGLAVAGVTFLRGDGPAPSTSGVPVLETGTTQASGQRPFRWIKVKPPTSPPPRNAFEQAVDYDSKRERVLVMGGMDLEVDPKRRNVFFSDLWAWDGKTWTELTSDGPRPKPRSQHAGAYDAKRDRFVIFGGFLGKKRRFTDAHWEWDGEVWRKIPNAKPWPEKRHGHGMIYDAKREAVLLFGGRLRARGGTNAVWTWDGSAFTRIETSTPRPIGRWAPGIAYDPLRETVVVYGGVKQVTGALEDMWELDGTTWREIPKQGPWPGPLYAGRLFHDGRRLVLSGGVHTWGDVATATWAWDGERWTQLRGQVLPERIHPGLAWDPARGNAVMFGGVRLDPPIRLAETWLFSEHEPDEPLAPIVDRGWHQRVVEPSPPARRGHIKGLVYDSKRSRILVFGGYEGSNTGKHWNELWAWDGDTWELIDVGDTKPQPRHAHAMVYDGDRDIVVLYAGSSPRDGFRRQRDVWEFHCATSTWVERTPLQGNAHNARSHGLAYDPKRRVTWLFGGQVDNERRGNALWSWDGMEWTPTRQRPPWPGVRESPAMSFDGTQGDVLLYGGVGAQGEVLGDFWAWNGRRWRALIGEGVLHPPPLHGASLIDIGGAMLLLGGAGSEQRAHDSIWSWDGTRWSKRFADQLPSYRTYGAVALDRKRNTLVLFGGKGLSDEPLGDTWEWALPR